MLGQSGAPVLPVTDHLAIANDLTKMQIDSNVAEADVGVREDRSECRFHKWTPPVPCRRVIEKLSMWAGTRHHRVKLGGLTTPLSGEIRLKLGNRNQRTFQSSSRTRMMYYKSRTPRVLIGRRMRPLRDKKRVRVAWDCPDPARGGCVRGTERPLYVLPSGQVGLSRPDQTGSATGSDEVVRRLERRRSRGDGPESSQRCRASPATNPFGGSGDSQTSWRDIRLVPDCCIASL